jgi:hypothetical protein
VTQITSFLGGRLQKQIAWPRKEKSSGHNGDIRRAAYGFEPTREAAMTAFARSWRQQ